MRLSLLIRLILHGGGYDGYKRLKVGHGTQQFALVGPPAGVALAGLRVQAKPPSPAIRPPRDDHLDHGARAKHLEVATAQQWKLLARHQPPFAAGQARRRPRQTLRVF